MSDLDEVRRLGVLTETIHAAVYFAPEPQERYAALGLRGFWRGYFASRASALGPVEPELVTALFGGFAPAMVARAIPSVWDIASPGQVRAARLDGATEALHRLLGDSVGDASLQAAGELTCSCIAMLPVAGRPMAAALAALDRPLDPLGALWLDCSVLREHRGDAHLEAVAESGLRWPEPHLLQADRLDPRLQEFRGWDDATWQAAAAAVSDISAADLESRTDELAAPAYTPLSVAKRSTLVGLLTPIAERASSALPYPNPIGVPPVLP
jgi:hypothetical protein